MVLFLIVIGNIRVYLNASYLYDRSPVHLLTIMWSAKEALFKWYSLGEIDFKEHMQLSSAIVFKEEELQLPFIFKKHDAIPLLILSKIFDELVLSWIITKE